MRDNYLSIPWNFEKKKKSNENKKILEEKIEEKPYALPKNLQKQKLPFLARFMTGISLTVLGLNITIYHSPLTKKYFTQEISVQDVENVESERKNEREPNFKWVVSGESAKSNSNKGDETALKLEEIYEKTEKKITNIEYLIEKEISYKLIENRIKIFNADSKFSLDDKTISNNAIRDAYNKVMNYYFEQYNKELLGLEGFFVNYCFEKKIDPAFVFSVIYNESTVGTQGWGYYNKNPGNLRGYGTLGNRGGYAYFKTWKDGIKALIDLLSEEYSKLTVRKAIYIYAPPNENETIKLTNDIVNVTKKALKRVYNYLKTSSVILNEDNQNY